MFLFHGGYIIMEHSLPNINHNNYVNQASNPMDHNPGFSWIFQLAKPFFTGYPRFAITIGHSETLEVFGFDNRINYPPTGAGFRNHPQ